MEGKVSEREREILKHVSAEEKKTKKFSKTMLMTLNIFQRYFFSFIIIGFTGEIV